MIDGDGVGALWPTFDGAVLSGLVGLLLSRLAFYHLKS